MHSPLQVDHPEWSAGADFGRVLSDAAGAPRWEPISV
jgi:hypothetical protein